jgi:hypothetical protein
MVRTNSALLGLAESHRSRLRATLIDEIRSLSLGLNGDNLFFQFVNTCYEKCEIIFPTSANEEHSLATAGWRRLCLDGLFFLRDQSRGEPSTPESVCVPEVNGRLRLQNRRLNVCSRVAANDTSWPADVSLWAEPLIPRA